MENKKYPKIIYKYRNWKDRYHKNVLRKNQLYMSSPKDLNDPFDCRIPKNFHLLDTPESKACYAHFQSIFLSKELHLQGYSYKDSFFKILNSLRDIEAYQKHYEEIFFNNQDEDYAILSMSGRWNSIAMWSHYSDNHKGYCIGFWEEKMRNSQKFGFGGPVEYHNNNNYPIIRPYEYGMKKTFITSHTKSTDWRHEEEYRLSDLLITDNPKIKKSRIRTIPNDFIAEINLGLMISEKDREDILKLAIKKNVKVYQLKKVPFKFKLTRERIL